MASRALIGSVAKKKARVLTLYQLPTPNFQLPNACARRLKGSVTTSRPAIATPRAVNGVSFRMFIRPLTPPAPGLARLPRLRAAGHAPGAPVGTRRSATIPPQIEMSGLTPPPTYRRHQFTDELVGRTMRWNYRPWVTSNAGRFNTAKHSRRRRRWWR
jgi:hypothetical protein